MQHKTKEMDTKLSVNIYAEGNVGRVDIIGQINEWNKNNATDMRAHCLELKESGANSCHVYLMTVGGDCFQANEIVNILTEVFGHYTGSGGAIVASAGTYIAIKAQSFEIVENGQLMIHKPMGGTFGNETELENYLQLVKNMTVTYYDAYLKKLKKPEADFKTKWESGDFWMTAGQAQEWGFVDNVKGTTPVDATSNALLEAMGRPIQKQSKINTKMDVKALAISLGMPENSTEEEVNARIKENAIEASGYNALKAQQEQREKEALSAKVEDKLKAAQKDKKIEAKAVELWREKLTADFDGTSELLDSIPGIVKPLSDEIKPTAAGVGATYKGKTFEQLQDESPEALEALMDENPEAYDKLFADWQKRN